MPTYEYKCLECNHTFSVFQSMKDDPVKLCEKCNGHVRKVFGTAGIIFKGPGFYVNDYKKNNSNNGSPSEKSDAISTSSSSDSSSNSG